MVFDPKEYARQYYLRNRDRILVRTTEYSQAHKSEKKIYDRIRYLKRKENKEIKKREVSLIKIGPGLKITFD